MTTLNQQILLASRPAGEPTVDNFRLVETPLPALVDGQVLVRHHFLSLDPYMRGRMNDAKSYAAPQPLDQVMLGGTASLLAWRSTRGVCPRPHPCGARAGSAPHPGDPS